MRENKSIKILCTILSLDKMINNNVNGIMYKSEELNPLYQMLCKLLSMKQNELLELGRNSRK